MFPFRQKPKEHVIGGVRMFHTSDGKWRATFEHRGSPMTLFAESKHALRDTLLELKKVDPPLGWCKDHISAQGAARIYECYTTRPTQGPWQLPETDEWLLLHNLVRYGVRHERFDNSTFKANPNLYPVTLTEKGSELASDLFSVLVDYRASDEQDKLHTVQSKLVEDFYRLDEPRGCEVYVVANFHSILHITGTEDEARQLYEECDYSTRFMVRVLPEFVAPPAEGAVPSYYWVLRCTECLLGDKPY